MSLCKYDKVSLTTFSSGIASCRAQIFSISISLTIDVARYFCLPLTILPLLHPTLGSWVYQYKIHQRTFQLLMGLFQWQNIWGRVNLDIHPPGCTPCEIATFAPQLKASSQDSLYKIHSFWVPGTLTPSHIPSGLGAGNSSSAHTFKNSLFVKQISNHSAICFQVRTWLHPSCTALQGARVNLQTYQQCRRVFVTPQPHRHLILTDLRFLLSYGFNKVDCFCFILCFSDY